MTAAVDHLEKLRFLNTGEIDQIVETWGTPAFVYDEQTMQMQADVALGMDVPFGLDVRYAMKANPNSYILRIFNDKGIGIDASSGYEAERAIRAGVDPSEILITSQELPKDLAGLVEQGVKFNACSLHQLETYGKLFPGKSVGVRLNPGLGSGHSNKTNVGGPASSFGIWHEYVNRVNEITATHGLTIDRLHTHIGSGTDPAVWLKAAELSLAQVEEFPDVTTLNLGGGFKVARTHDEFSTDLEKVGQIIGEALGRFYERTGRQLKLEIEPGTFLVANAGSLITNIHDIVDTGEEGYTFIKIDSGMTEILRPNLYGAQHPLVVVSDRGEEGREKYVVVGHCCESGDMLTPYPGDPEAIAPRLLAKAAIGDKLVIEGVGAYCAYMSAQNYNSFPLRPEVLRRTGGSLVEICRRETMNEMLSLETWPQA